MRILVVRLSALGDIVHALPAVAALRRALPAARIDWLVDERYRELVDLVPVVDHRITLPRGRRISGAPRVVQALRATRYDIALDLQGLLKSGLLARGSGARRVIGFDRAHRRERAAGWLYTETPPLGEPAHVIERNLALAACLDAPPRPLEFPCHQRRCPRDRAGTTGVVVRRCAQPQPCIASIAVDEVAQAAAGRLAAADGPSAGPSP